MTEINRKNVRDILDAYEAIRERAIEIVRLPTTPNRYNFEEDRFIVVICEDDPSAFEIISWSSGYDCIEENGISVPASLFEMSNEEFAAHAEKTHAEEAARRLDLKRCVAAAQEYDMRKEYERLKEKLAVRTTAASASRPLIR